MGMGRLSKRFWQAIAIVVAVVIVLVVVYVGFQKVAYKTYTAYFASVNSMYEGDAVKILGVTGANTTWNNCSSPTENAACEPSR